MYLERGFFDETVEFMCYLVGFDTWRGGKI